MDIQAIGVAAFSVYIPESELERRHMTPSTITARQARTLVGSLIGPDTSDTVSLELYPGRHEVLIFVRRSVGEPDYYSFEDFEDVLEAIAALGGSVTASLFYIGGVWVLAVWREGAGGLYDLTEFGDPLDTPSGYLAHLREHGEIICDGDAAPALRKAFLGQF